MVYPVCTHRKHLFVPAAWLRKEFPDRAEVCDLIERRVREALAREATP
jgi:hypothetical protein